MVVTQGTELHNLVADTRDVRLAGFNSNLSSSEVALQKRYESPARDRDCSALVEEAAQRMV